MHVINIYFVVDRAYVIHYIIVYGIHMHKIV